jgi:hypothetical protein
VEDITRLSGIWCMKIVPEAGSLKTAGSERVVPLHPASCHSYPNRPPGRYS